MEVEATVCEVLTVHEVPDPAVIYVPDVTPVPLRARLIKFTDGVVVVVSVVPEIDPVNVVYGYHTAITVAAASGVAGTVAPIVDVKLDVEAITGGWLFAYQVIP